MTVETFGAQLGTSLTVVLMNIILLLLFLALLMTVVYWGTKFIKYLTYKLANVMREPGFDYVKRVDDSLRKSMTDNKEEVIRSKLGEQVELLIK